MMTDLAPEITPERGTGLQVDEERSLRARFAYFYKLLKRDKSGIIGLSIFIALVLTAVFAAQIAPHDPEQQNLRMAKSPPVWMAEGTWEYPLGTDNLGRDLLSRIIFGTCHCRLCRGES